VDAATNSAIQSTTVAGNYTPLDFSPQTTNPYCVGNSNGQIVGNQIAGTGNPPLSWQLIAPSPITTTQQSSDTFNNLIAGNYTVRLSDACGSFRTIVATVPIPNTQMTQYSVTYIEKGGCDSSWITSAVQMQLGEVRLPLSIKFITKNGVYIPPPGSTQIDSSHLSSGGIVFLRQLVPGVSYGDSVTSVIYNACGDSIVLVGASDPYNFSPEYTFNGCGTSVNVSFNYADVSTPYYGLKSPVTYTLVDTATNVMADSGTVTSVPSLAIYYEMITGLSITPALPTGETYKLTVTDGCGKIFIHNYTTPTDAAPAVIGNDILYSPCIDSVMGVYRIHTEGFGGNPILILLSGPSTLGSTKPGFAYSDTYSYPDSIGGGEYIFLNNLAVGTYQYKIIDDCGHQVSDSIVVTPSEMISLSWNDSYQKGCLGQNKIYYTLAHENSMGYVPVSAGAVIVKNISTGVIVKSQASYNNVYSDSVLNVPSGQYEITYEFQEPAYGTSINQTYTSCWTTKDTITLAGYQTPEISSSNAIICHNIIYAQLLPDSSKGIPPYQYGIIAGPQTFPTQDSNVFIITQPGTYTAQIFDVCGNGSATQITIDSTAFPPINRIATNCSSTKLFYGSSIYYNYQWTKPNGTIYTGDTLTIDPITSADTGTYFIRKIVNISGCTDTVYTSYHLSLIATYTQTIPYCNGTVVHVGTSTYNTPGIYSDTLRNVNSFGCDSIIITSLIKIQKSDTSNVTICKGSNITIGTNTYSTSGLYEDSVLNAAGCYDLKFTNLTVTQLRDTVTKSICKLDSIVVGSNVYRVAGTYIDTLTSSLGCDSIVVLNLSINPPDIFVLDDTVAVVICQGDSLGFGTTLYTQSGIYQDTLVEGCSGLVITVNATVNPYKKDSIVQSICTGQSYTLGTKAYSATGIYRDTLSTLTCDSIVILNLTVGSCSVSCSSSVTIDTTICAGQNFLGHTTTGTYLNTLINVAGCDSLVTLHLTIDSAAPITIDANPTVVIRGGVVQLNTTASGPYLWTSAEAISNNAIQDPTAVVNTSSWIYLYDVSACPSVDSIFISVRADSNPCVGSYILVPNAFTPNNDGRDDLFKIISDNIRLQDFQIYNRWGQMVFETANIDQGWNGTYQGQRSDAGNYVYWISYFDCSTTGKPKIIKGNIVLIR